MWCRLKRVTAPSKLPVSNASAVASPIENDALRAPSRSASRRASSTIAGVMSTPCTSPTRAASPRATRPGPQAASSQRSPGAAGISSSRRPRVSSERIAGAALNASDWWVNSRTVASSSTPVFYRRGGYCAAMAEERITVSTPAGEIAAWRGGSGAETAVLLHGGPGMSDYLETLTPLLGDRFHTIRYQQRGVAPTTIGPPYTVEAHVEDAITVIDHQAGGRAWIVGHSWGGHLALHMLVACPDRLAGAVIVDPLGAHMDVMEPFGDRLQAGLTDAQRERSAELDAREDAGEATSEDSREALAMVWPNYFADPATAFPMPPLEFGAAGYAGTTASVAEHAERATLVDGLPHVPASIPVVFIHGEASPMPMRASTATAALIPHARVVAIADAGHFPWLEQPGAFMSALDM
jgi:proline iminopeptidase